MRSHATGVLQSDTHLPTELGYNELHYYNVHKRDTHFSKNKRLTMSSMHVALRAAGKFYS